MKIIWFFSKKLKTGIKHFFTKIGFWIYVIQTSCQSVFGRKSRVPAVCMHKKIYESLLCSEILSLNFRNLKAAAENFWELCDIMYHVFRYHTFVESHVLWEKFEKVVAFMKLSKFFQCNFFCRIWISVGHDDWFAVNANKSGTPSQILLF